MPDPFIVTVPAELVRPGEMRLELNPVPTCGCSVVSRYVDNDNKVTISIQHCLLHDKAPLMAEFINNCSHSQACRADKLSGVPCGCGLRDIWDELAPKTPRGEDPDRTSS